MSYAKAFFLAALAIDAARAEKPPITDARQLLAYIGRKGAATTLDELDEKALDRVFARIRTGTPLWLEVAKKLAPVTDASAAIGMQVELARALTHNPEGVLPLLGAPGEIPLGIDIVCGIPLSSRPSGMIGNTCEWRAPLCSESRHLLCKRRKRNALASSTRSSA
jgi:hypothetical protein